MAQTFESTGAPLAESPSALPGQHTPDSIHPGLRPSLTSVPVTPGIHLGEYDSKRAGSGSSSYFTQNPARASNMAQTPSQLAAGATDRHDVLRRMSLSDSNRQEEPISELSIKDPRAAHPQLGLSGNVISATFCIPQSLRYRKGQDWGMSSRRGTSALFDSFVHLSSEKTPWNHTLVGWTGEISLAEELTPPNTPPGYRLPPLNASSAPIPFEGYEKPEEPATQHIDISKEDQSKLEWQLAHDKTCKTLPVWLHDEETTTDGSITLHDQGRWRRYAEHELYTLFHYKQNEPSDGRVAKKSFADYVRLNQKFATRILEVYKPGDVVMIHDYHLLLLPGMLRQKVPNMYITFFLHVPFPSSEFMRGLPERKQILEGVLHADVIGFQSYGFSRHFSSCCTRILGFPSDNYGVDAYGQKVFVKVFPIGIDAAEVERLAFNAKIDAKVAALRELYKDRKIIVGRDRLDSVRGVPQKLMAFERFLEANPEWQEKVVLIQVTSPTSVEENQEDTGNKIANKVSDLVTKINGTYGSLGFAPVQHYSQYLSQDEYLALLRVADLGLITSVRDGMNTTSLEYVVCQRDNHGPLILSEFSGTAGSLNDAIHINPWDLAGVADAINNALTMSEEKKTVLHSSLYRHVTTHTMQAWSDNYLQRLLIVLKGRTKVATPALSSVQLLNTYNAANKRLFMFDYDGTLTPIVHNPDAAIPTERVISTLEALAEDPKNAVWIISGRDQNFLGKYLGHISKLGFSAEHGSFMRFPGTTEWVNLADTIDMTWQDEVFKVFEKYCELTPGSFIERKRCALTWHYRPSDPELGAINARKCSDELELTVGKKWDVDVMEGKANLEVRPTFINKGEIAKRLVADYNAESPLEFSLCLGDDFTDEDMFRALNASDLKDEYIFSCVVGASSKPTLAKWHVLEPSDVIANARALTGIDHGSVDGGLVDVAVAVGTTDAPHHTSGP